MIKISAKECKSRISKGLELVSPKVVNSLHNHLFIFSLNLQYFKNNRPVHTAINGGMETLVPYSGSNLLEPDFPSFSTSPLRELGLSVEK